MERYYLFKIEERADKEELLRLLDEIIPGVGVVFETESIGFFTADSSAFTALDGSLFGIQNQIDARIVILATHEVNYLSKLLLEEAYFYYPGRCVFLTDIIFKQFSHGNFSSLHYIKSMFKEVDEELMETVGAYLRSGLEGLIAAKSLNVHRNTFNYRLNEFIKATNLDIRDYHNALLLEIYFQYCNQ